MVTVSKSKVALVKCDTYDYEQVMDAVETGIGLIGGISNFVKEGENQLKIEVVNTWVNRIIGDMKLPEEERKTWAPHLRFNAESPLQSSGLFGPVRILTIGK